MSEHEARGLRARDVTVRYGGVTAVDGVSIEVLPGQVVGLIGPNGAGKTSLIDAITGFTSATGTIAVDGLRIDRLRPHQRRRAGLSRTWQSGELFGTLTVAENILASARPPTWSSLWSDLFGRRTDRLAVVEPILQAVGLGDFGPVQAGSLTLGQQKLVGVARALAGGCSILLLDEPAAGLDSTESLHFADRVRQIASSGPGVVLIDHDVDLVTKVCDRVDVLEFGRLIFSGPPTAMRRDPSVIAAYLGAPLEGTHA